MGCCGPLSVGSCVFLKAFFKRITANFQPSITNTSIIESVQWALFQILCFLHKTWSAVMIVLRAKSGRWQTFCIIWVSCGKLQIGLCWDYQEKIAMKVGFSFAGVTAFVSLKILTNQNFYIYNEMGVTEFEDRSIINTCSPAHIVHGNPLLHNDDSRCWWSVQVLLGYPARWNIF